MILRQVLRRKKEELQDKKDFSREQEMCARASVVRDSDVDAMARFTGSNQKWWRFRPPQKTGIAVPT